jgi:streptogramin lyase
MNLRASTRRNAGRRLIRLSRPAVEGLESRRLLAVAISEFPTEVVGGQPNSIVTGSDGNLWFTLPGADALGEINPTTHAFQFFPVTVPSIFPQTLTSGPDGNLWFTSGASIGTFNLTTHSFSATPIPSSGSPQDITTGPDGNLWFTEDPTFLLTPDQSFTIGEINPTTHVITEFNTPGTIFNRDITTGPDGNLWFTSNAGIGSFNPTTHAVAVFNVPILNAGLGAITAGPDGNLWFVESQVNRVAMINPTTHAISQFFLPTPNSFPASIATGPDGNLWITESANGALPPGGQAGAIPIGVSAIASINSTTHAIATYPTPSFNTAPQGITTGPDGNLWFTEAKADQIGEGIIHASDGPQITRVERVGFHFAPTTLVLTFNEPLDPTSAQNVGNYRIVGPRGWTIPVVSAVYNAANDTVTLSPSSRLNVHAAYQLTVNGTGSSGVKNIFGDLLDGAGTGQPGSDFVATLTRKNLVIARSTPRGPATPKAAHPSAKHAAPRHPRR